MFSSEFNERSRSTPLCDFRLGTVATSDHETPLTESGNGQSTKSEDDVDSGATFDEDSEKVIDTVEIEEEDWIDYIGSTADAIDKMEHARIRCWNKTHRKMKWKLALRIATSPSERWLKKKLLNGTLS